MEAFIFIAVIAIIIIYYFNKRSKKQISPEEFYKNLNKQYFSIDPNTLTQEQVIDFLNNSNDKYFIEKWFDIWKSEGYFFSDKVFLLIRIRIRSINEQYLFSVIERSTSSKEIDLLMREDDFSKRWGYSDELYQAIKKKKASFKERDYMYLIQSKTEKSAAAFLKSKRNSGEYLSESVYRAALEKALIYYDIKHTKELLKVDNNKIATQNWLNEKKIEGDIVSINTRKKIAEKIKDEIIRELSTLTPSKVHSWIKKEENSIYLLNTDVLSFAKEREAIYLAKKIKKID